MVSRIFMSMIKFNALKWNCTIIKSLRMSGKNSYHFSNMDDQRLTNQGLISLLMKRNVYKIYRNQNSYGEPIIMLRE